MKNKKGNLLMTVGIILMVGAAVLTAYNLLTEYLAGRQSEEVLYNMDIKAAGENDIPFYEIYPDMPMPVKVIDGREYIGKLYIEKLDRELPILSEFSYDGLRTAPCRYKGSIYKDDMIIAGHNYKTHFGNFRSLTIGDRVTFTDMDGNVFEYTIDAVENVDGRNIEGMEAGDWDLSLFTCNYRGDARVTMRCKRIIQQKTVDAEMPTVFLFPKNKC